MKLVESGPSCPKPRAKSACTSAPIAVASNPSRIHGLGIEDSWDTFALARYRSYTTNGHVLRLSNSEPDLLHRRPGIDTAAPRQHRRASTMPKGESQPWVRTGPDLPKRLAAAAATHNNDGAILLDMRP